MMAHNNMQSIDMVAEETSNINIQVINKNGFQATSTNTVVEIARRRLVIMIQQLLVILNLR